MLKCLPVPFFSQKSAVDVYPMASLSRARGSKPYQHNDENNAWRAFDTSSEAGRLLRQIYGNKNPPVNVPLPRRSGKSRLPTDGWRPVNNGSGQVDPRKATRNLAAERRVATVRRPRAAPTYSRIDFVERRKTGAVIHAQLEDTRMRTEAYRPAHVRPIGDAEKERFGEICAFKGGRGLPEELTAVTLDVLPHEQRARAKEAERVHAVRRRRAGLPETDPEEALSALVAAEAAKKKQQQGGGKGAMVEQLRSEIEERRAYLAELEVAGELGHAGNTERRVAMEISNRVSEMRRIDPAAAKEYGADVGTSQFKATREAAPFFRE